MRYYLKMITILTSLFIVLVAVVVVVFLAAAITRLKSVSESVPASDFNDLISMHH